MDEYSLFVEGGILSQLKENTPIGPEVSGCNTETVRMHSM